MPQREDRAIFENKTKNSRTAGFLLAARRRKGWRFFYWEKPLGLFPKIAVVFFPAALVIAFDLRLEDCPGQQINNQIVLQPGKTAWQIADGNWRDQVPFVTPNHGSVCYVMEDSEPPPDALQARR